MSKKILIVDDDVILAQEMTEILCGHGYSVENASDSSKGLQLIKENVYDIYLFDYKMTGLSGIDLLKEVKETNEEASVFIISGRPAIDNLLREANVAHLVSCVLKKPFDVEVLLQKIKDHTEP